MEKKKNGPCRWLIKIPREKDDFPWLFELLEGQWVDKISHHLTGIEMELYILTNTNNIRISDWWFQPSENYKSHLGLLFPMEKMFKTCSQITNRIYDG